MASVTIPDIHPTEKLNFLDELTPREMSNVIGGIQVKLNWTERDIKLLQLIQALQDPNRDPGRGKMLVG
ncbi:hypothetical protein [Nostoc sp. 106C]|uniref:hypothetical protein n=1 Tax=Nostoc sp. 106C TaxID=1932667 RepID=UPI000A3D32A4|nr:hypothetical protein [Nostoc sp. 106C]OUL28074.1 hypothetical protein BV375_18955 [Nostoc sp. 106C]